MPGRIDTHVHMELPFMGTISADDFYRNCFTGLAGGTTLIMDFCVAFPGTRLTEAYEQHLVKSSKSAGDYSFHMGKEKIKIKKKGICEFTEHTEKDMEYLVKEKGINSFKMFMAYKGALMIDDESIMKIFQICKRLKVRVL
jgi:dihydropyrimidinase